MAKIIPKLNLNKTPQSAENNSLIFAKDIMLNKDNTISRDEVLYKVLDSSNLSGYKIAGFISYNNEFYIFLFKRTGDAIIASKIVKYVENSDNTFTTSNVSCNWNYSGGEIDGLVIKSLNGDTLLIINEYNAIKDVPLKTINLNTCTVADDESIYSQLPNIPIINLINTGNYSQKIPKGVYQFFIRFEISKDFYTDWMPCSKELFAYNTTYKRIVQGTIKFVDEQADADFSFILTPELVTNSNPLLADPINNYNRFQLGFILSNNDSNVCRTWKHFDMSYITSNTPIYFSYEQTDIEEYDIDEMTKYTFNLYNVKNVTSFKNKIYISNYKETDFNPNIEINASVTYNYIDNNTLSISDNYNDNVEEIRLNGTTFNKNELFNNTFQKVFSTNDTDSISDYINISVEEEDNVLDLQSEDDYHLVIGNDYSKYKIFGGPGSRINYQTFFQLEADIASGEIIDNSFSSLFIKYENEFIPCFLLNNELLSSTVLHYQYLIGSSRKKYKITITLKYSVVSYISQVQYDRSLLPKTGYNFYLHFVKQTGEITNGYKISNVNNITNWFDKNIKVCFPSFSNVTIPNGYVAAFITYAKTKNKYIDVVNQNVSLTGKDGTTYYLYDCIEVDSALSAKWDKIKLYSGDDNLIKDSDAFYRPSSFYDDNLPKLFGATGKIVSTKNVSNPYILDEFEVSEDKVELIKLTPYFNSSTYNSYTKMNIRGFISKVYKPQNISEYDDGYDNKSDEFKVAGDNTKVVDELTYYYTGTDIYTKSANGDLNQYKSRKDIGTSSYIKFISEYNLDCLIIANQVIDMTRPYYVKDVSEGTTVTTTDATYEYHGGTPNASTWASNYEGKYIIIPDCLCTEEMVSESNTVNENVRNLKLNPLDKYLNHTSNNNNRLLFFKNGAITETLADLRNNSSNYKGNSDIIIDNDVFYCQKLLEWSDLAAAKNAGDLQLISSDDVGSVICRVYKYGPVSEYNKGGVKSITIVTQTKATAKYEDRIVESNIKTSTTYKFGEQRVYADGYNGIVPQADNIQDETHAYWRTDDFGLIWYGNKGEPTIVKEPSIDVSENNGEINAYQQYSYIESLNLSSLYKLPSMYINITRKAYSKVDISNNIVKFDNTIRSSDIYTDESKKYVFKFDATSYYNVDCSKGKIVNLVTVGNYIIVHTEDSIFTFSGSNSLQTTNGEAKLSESNVFDTGVTEVVGSKYGYCGLKQKNHACVTQSGYIFYDASVNKIYAYTGQGSVNTISDSIDKLMKLGRIIDVNFGNDYYNDRLLICIKYNINDNIKFATLSFNYRLNSFVSAHNFWFDKSFNTKTNVYYASRGGAISGKFNAISFSDKKTQTWTGLLNDFYNSENITDIFPRLTIDNNLASVIDVIYNESYELVKTLNSVNWVCNSIYDFDEDNTLMAEEKYEKSDNIVNYPGDKIKIYTDTCRTEDIQVYSQTVNNSYEKPRYNNGIWSFNYFRNISTGNTNNSDDKSLIYGKYIILRFIFDSYNHDFKLENVIFNISK